MNRLQELAASGQSVWCDFVRRLFVTSGELSRWIGRGVSGVTSSPYLYEKAIAASQDYDGDLKVLAGRGLSVDEMYESLAVTDMRLAADALAWVYEQTRGRDGFVTMGLDPAMARDADWTVAAALRLFSAVGRENVMIKVPATTAGVEAIRRLTAAGVNVNATLGFGEAACVAAAQAFLEGLGELSEKGPKAPGGIGVDRLGCLVSVYAGRMDDTLGRALERAGEATFKGMAPGVALARLIHGRLEETLSTDKARALAEKGVRLPLTLFTSMDVRNPALGGTHYVDALALPGTKATCPPRILAALLDAGSPPAPASPDEARETVERLFASGLDIPALADRLQEQALADYASSSARVRKNIEGRRALIVSAKKSYAASLGPLAAKADQAVKKLRDEDVLARIWSGDHTVWKPEPTEISNRLGWLWAPETMAGAAEELAEFTDSLRREGFTHALLLGMGGSSLAPELFARTFTAPGFLDLAVLDSTDPGAVLARTQRSDPARTLYIVSSKSGGTEETLSFLKYCWDLAVKALGKKEAGRHFAAITDPGSGLFAMARDLGFRKVFVNDPNVGGRYSALTWFGLTAAALVGADCGRLLRRAQAMAANAHSCNCPVDGDNTAARLGAALAVAAAKGKDKLTLITSPSIAAFGPWVEQLVAESTGKEGKGILPIAGEPVGPPASYAEDRLFVYLRLIGEHTHDAAVAALEQEGRPVIRLHLRDLHDLGGEFFRWEMATAVAGALMHINPFDQPNVESAKKEAKKMVAAYRETGTLPEAEPSAMDGPIRVYAGGPVTGIAEALEGLFAHIQEGPPRSYLALCAFIAPTPEADNILARIRAGAAARYGIAVTAEYGPRFLHSTGQLHKGDAGNGLFIQLTADMPEDAPIPDEPGGKTSSLSFGVLKKAQALGDALALAQAGRPVVGFHLGKDPMAGLRRLEEEMG
ncbi:MAG: bifunctional transaldolase/phosoglucose isomerase [Pseudomonadota bacterium]